LKKTFEVLKMIKTLNQSKLANICESIPKWTKTQNSNVSTLLVTEIELIEDLGFDVLFVYFFYNLQKNVSSM
jgi:hypothetical protein